MRAFAVFLTALVAVVILGTVADLVANGRHDHLTVAGETLNRGRQDSPAEPVADAENTDAEAAVVLPRDAVYGPGGEPVIVPEGTNLETTPLVLLDGVYVPEESPAGGYPVGWADNSPEYSDGWIVQVNDVNGSVGWVQL